MASNPAPEAATRDAGLRGVILVCHAGADLGIGHLTRMLALAHALERQGMDRVDVVVQGDPVVRSDLDRFSCTFVGLESDLAEVVLAAAADLVPGVVVFDLHPELVPEGLGGLLGSLAAGGARLVGVDGLLDFCDLLDVSWIPSFSVDSARLERCSGEVHHGWDSFLIRKRLPTRAWRPGRRVLVLTGGSDVTGQSQTLPALLDGSVPSGTELHWVRGPFAAAPAIPSNRRVDWKVHEAPEGLDELVVESHYALTVFGVTLFEVLQYGVPTVVFSPYEDRDQPELALLEGEGVAVVADGAETAVAGLVELMGDARLAGGLSQAALDRLQVDGADRLAGLIHSLV